MKKVIAILMLLATLVSMSLVSNAGTAFRIKKGTPVIDGKLDAMYRESPAMPLSNNPGAIGQGDTTGGKHVAKSSDAYALWDDNYLYFYIVAWDDTLMDSDAIALAFNIGEFYMFDIKFKTDDYGLYDNDASRFDLENCQIVGGLNTEGGYLYVEARIALSAEKKSAALGSGKQFGFHWVFWNDVDGDGSHDNCSLSSDFRVDNLFLSANKATATGNVTNDAGQDIYGSTGTAVPPYTAEYTPSTDDGGNNNNNNNNGGNKNPQTADGIAVVGAVALCAAAAAVILIRKKRA